MPESTTAIRLPSPAAEGSEIHMSISGDEAFSLDVVDGVVNVPDQHVPRILGAFPGAELEVGSPDASEPKEQ